eukprot:CAMPEP_0197028582 /NCGR_PEP_ID=MMETSP1384-20130603/8234_1 /TAXON_ID=29189 /ORGANISM="Ammonia sp." /LENGTH=496 /DNA_ID=CAMNT_0042457601 /DNA_START=20 /DNA_END=1510 /DNA_ORIENTATION=+
MKQSLTKDTPNVNTADCNRPQTPSNTNEFEHDTEDTAVTFRAVLRYPVYRRYLFFFLVCFLAFYERASFLSGYGAAYFGGCKTVKANNNCSKPFNYDRFNLVLQASLSVANLFAFITAPLIGRLSDIYGRKPFICAQLIIYAIPYLFILFYNNMFVFLVLWALQGLNGSTQISTPVTQAYISDILPQRLHIMAYALMYLLSGFGLLLGEIAGFLISSLFNDHFNFYVITALYALCLTYLLVFIPESNTRTSRHIQQAANMSGDDGVEEKKSVNPLAVFRFCCMNKIVFWCSVLTGLVTLPAMGLIDIATVVLADNFDADSDHKYNQIALFYICGWSVGLMVGPIVVLPVMRKLLSEYMIFVASICILLLAIGAFALICVFKVLWTVPIASFTLGIGFLCFAPLNSILTKYTGKSQKGMAFGPVFACGSVVNILAPIGFAFGYHFLLSIHAPSLIFGVAFVLLLFALLCSVGLKNAIKHIEDERKRHFGFDEVADTA